VAPIARHKFDNEIPTVLGSVYGIGESPAGVEVDV
jgi:hypothetical protein